jgi:hypothetical protein
VFRVGGTIEIVNRLYISGEDDSYVTIAGQTAPGDGIQVKGNVLTVRDGAHDVVIRYMRFRPGPGVLRDAIWLFGNDGTHIHDVILDHVSLEWATDENWGNTYNVSNVTVQWSILAEGIVGHGAGSLICCDATMLGSIHHNLYAHNEGRNPEVEGEIVDVRNNIVYNWRWAGNFRFEGGVHGNAVKNALIAGPDSEPDPARIQQDAVVYLEDNYSPHCPYPCENQLELGFYRSTILTADQPYDTPPVTTHEVAELLDVVLPVVGDNLPSRGRDAVDERIVNDVLNGSGAIGMGSDYPVLASGTPYPDADGDGMDDDWELARGLDPGNAEDRNGDDDADGYTNLEEFLHELTF